VKDLVKALFGAAGLEVRRRARQPEPGASGRPVGDLLALMEDLRARGFAPASIVDIGANRGDWSAAVSSVFPDAAYFLFEPVAQFDPMLESFVARHPRSRFWRAAVGSSEGVVEMDMIFTQDGKPTTGSTLQAARHDPAYRVQKTPVQVVTLDGLLASGGFPAPPDLVKIDVEGYEKDVLSGARQLLGRTEVFILECSLYRFWGTNLVFRETLALMQEYGYELYDFAGFNRRPRDGALGQTDAVFVRRESRLRRETPWDE
jgi:FkbM family methyltransferase